MNLRRVLAPVLVGLCVAARLSPSFAADSGPAYTPSGEIVLPADYREWVFLTSSFGLNYDEPVPGAAPRDASHSMLDNVFVNPAAYRAFLQTGTWPDKTILVKENRIADSTDTGGRNGRFQAAIGSMELHVKDERRFPGKWAFFVTDGKVPGRLMPPSASCYSCHEDHAAVDTTFVQFYPTLMDIARAKATLSAKYLSESAKKK